MVEKLYTYSDQELKEYILSSYSISLINPKHTQEKRSNLIYKGEPVFTYEYDIEANKCFNIELTEKFPDFVGDGYNNMILSIFISHDEDHLLEFIRDNQEDYLEDKFDVKIRTHELFLSSLVIYVFKFNNEKVGEKLYPLGEYISRCSMFDIYNPTDIPYKSDIEETFTSV